MRRQRLVYVFLHLRFPAAFHIYFVSNSLNRHPKYYIQVRGLNLTLKLSRVISWFQSVSIILNININIEQERPYNCISQTNSNIILLVKVRLLFTSLSLLSRGVYMGIFPEGVAFLLSGRVPQLGH